MKMRDIKLFHMSKQQRRVALKIMFIGGIMFLCQGIIWGICWPFILIGRLTENYLDKLYFQYDLIEYLEAEQENTKGEKNGTKV